ncbi:Proteasome subunit beta type-7 [Periplaneta americana]|uniref:Proteasome subunit beta type-7 n=1 Tax=Periplaneta americana TaxID=6978 RepID=A0ABQ8T919_PERAM|nr:Proteasome subunit beta type-7 [Periplaneta americana]
MASVLVPDFDRPGFSFENCIRNEFLAKKGFPISKAKKTGTTIVGITYRDGIILGADTRATENTIVADKTVPRFTT